MDFNKIRSFCQKFRILLGTILIIAGFFITAEEEFYNLWFGLGIIPLIAGIANFCPLCIISKKCDLPEEK
jgi:dipeptide/tripeptide permease